MDPVYLLVRWDRKHRERVFMDHGCCVSPGSQFAGIRNMAKLLVFPQCPSPFLSPVCVCGELRRGQGTFLLPRPAVTEAEGLGRAAWLWWDPACHGLHRVGFMFSVATSPTG